MPPYDPRSVANLVLDLAADMADCRPLKHIALQKLLFFSHAQHLVYTKQGLLAGEFEAWKFGPVHPVVYNTFKWCGANVIIHRATIRNILARTEVVAPQIHDVVAIDSVRRVLYALGGLRASELVELSHAPHGAWKSVVDKARTESSLGLKIPDKLIAERFYRLVPLSGKEHSSGEPSEDTPLSS